MNFIYIFYVKTAFAVACGYGALAEYVLEHRTVSICKIRLIRWGQVVKKLLWLRDLIWAEWEWRGRKVAWKVFSTIWINQKLINLNMRVQDSQLSYFWKFLMWILVKNWKVLILILFQTCSRMQQIRIS